MQDTRPIFGWSKYGQVTMPLLSLILFGIFLTFANSAQFAPHSAQEPYAKAAVVALGIAIKIPDAHGHATQHACHSSGSCTTVALATMGASLPKIRVADAQEFGEPTAGITRAVRPDIKPPIA